MHGGLLMSDQHMCDAVLLNECVIERENGTARVAEDDVHTQVRKKFKHERRTGQLWLQGSTAGLPRV
jgi:hypothetical protein